MSILKLLDGNGYIAGGDIIFKGQNLKDCSWMRCIRSCGNEISVIFQEPMTSLNPVFTIEKQIAESYIVHQHMSKKEAKAKAVEMLAAVKIPNPEAVAKQYPHQLSRRYASARNDRNGAGLRAEPSDRGRTDHRA